MTVYAQCPRLRECPEDKRRKALQERRLEREHRIEEMLVHWEREIVPNWKVVFTKPALRRLWWQGIPSKLRATMWQSAVGNELSLSKGPFVLRLMHYAVLTGE